MAHLSEKEMYDFIRIDSFDAESARLVSRVNRHILECARCAEELKRRERFCETVAAMSAQDFSLDDLLPCDFDIPAYEVAAETERVAEEEQSDKYGFRY